MLVRLAFAIMIQSDAEILLIDEVLAVGDAAFQQKCKDVFHEIRGSDRTVVLVTHDMTAVEEYCHRAMLLDEGDIVLHRRPRRGRASLPADQLRDRRRAGESAAAGAPRRHPARRRLDRALDGERTTNVEQRPAARVPRRVRGAGRDRGPELRLHAHQRRRGRHLRLRQGARGAARGRRRARPRRTDPRQGQDREPPGGRPLLHLLPGLRQPLVRRPAPGVPRIVDFVVFGTDQTVGVVSIFPESSITRERA